MSGRTSFRGFVVGACGALLAALVFSGAGCDDSEHHHHDSQGQLGCGQALTCGACTPLVGCGWCETPGGAGLCASDPDECANVSAFSWTWDPSGCRVAADAGVVGSVDSGGSPIAIDAAAGQSIDAESTGPADAASGS